MCERRPIPPPRKCSSQTGGEGASLLKDSDLGSRLIMTFSETYCRGILLYTAVLLLTTSVELFSLLDYHLFHQARIHDFLFNYSTMEPMGEEGTDNEIRTHHPTPSLCPIPSTGGKKENELGCREGGGEAAGASFALPVTAGLRCPTRISGISADSATRLQSFSSCLKPNKGGGVLNYTCSPILGIFAIM